MSDEDLSATPVALSIHGLDGSRERAGALEKILAHLTGVVRAYVSPFTALAYVDYRPAELSEADLVQTITSAGFGVDERARRFAWRRN